MIGRNDPYRANLDMLPKRILIRLRMGCGTEHELRPLLPRPVQIVLLIGAVVAAAEVVVGLAILMAIYRARRSASVDDANLLKN